MADGCRYEAQLARGVPTGRRNASAASIGNSSTKAAAARRSSRGSSPTSATFCRRQQVSGLFHDVVVVPIGFISDHLEVVYDLDTEARQLCDDLGINMVRAATVGTHPRFVRMIRELIEERLSDSPHRLALGALGPKEDVCPDDCCLYVSERTKC